MTTLQDIRKVAVIGCGPSGIAAAKYLLAENCFSVVTVFEQRPSAGGAWNATVDYPVPASFHAPSTTPSTEVDRQPTSREYSSPTFFFSPIYPVLTTNIPHELMSYDDFSFPHAGKIPLFPSHAVVSAYLKDYAKQIIDRVNFSVQVTDVCPIGFPGQIRGWSVTTLDLVTGDCETSTWDAVICANGHFEEIFIPEILGMKEWSGEITHSKYFRRGEDFTGKKVILVGNGASGTDLADHIAPFSSSLIVSGRTPSKLPQVFPGIIDMPEISSLDETTHAVKFANDAVEKDVDVIIFCTGYLYSFHFLHLPEAFPPAIINGERVNNTFEHIFYTPEPTLSFVGLPQRIIPFPDAESQSAVIARIYSGRLKLPSRVFMEIWERDRVAIKGDGRGFHCMPFPEDADNMNKLYSWANSAERGGLLPKWWNEKDYWVRERVPAMKSAVRKLNRDGKGSQVTTMEQLGFDFEEWKREKDRQGI